MVIVERMRGRHWAIATLMLGGTTVVSAACSSSNAACAPGAERCGCFPNGTCNPGLSCNDSVCISEGGGTGNGTGGLTFGSNGGSANGGTNAGGTAGTTGGATGSTAGASGGTGSTAGTAGTSSGTGSTAGSSSGANSSGGTAGTSSGTTDSCPGAPTGGLALNDKYQSAVGFGGYCYSYADSSSPCNPCGSSTSCVSSTALCALGTSVSNISAANWGAGFGCLVDQAQATTANPNPTAYPMLLSGSGISYRLSEVPSGSVYIIVDDSGTDYFCPVYTLSGTCTWLDFNTAPWSTTGVTLGINPTAMHVEFEAASGPETESWQFCVASLSLAP